MIEAVSAGIEAELFAGYMRLRRGWATFRDGGQETTERGVVLSGPGHDVVIIAAVMIEPEGRPHLVFKGGDTRPARTLRGEPYVKIGSIGGRLDHQGVGSSATAILELAEETGAEVQAGLLFPLSRVASPTMPEHSTEADHYYAAIVQFPEDARPVGDGGGMELSELLRPIAFSASEGLLAIDQGAIGEGARARVAATRAFCALGYLPALGRWRSELPERLQRRFDPLGLSPPAPNDWPRATLNLPARSDETRVVACHLEDERSIDVGEGLVFRNAWASHLGPSGEVVGRPYRIQFLHVPHDLTKVVRYAKDPIHGARVALQSRPRVPLAVKALALQAELQSELVRPVLLDVEERVVRVGGPAAVEAELADWAKGQGAALERLGAPSDASPGQSDLRYHFYAQEIAPGPALVPLAEAIRLFRSGDGDAAAECALYRLADRLGYVPELGTFAGALDG